MNDNKKNVTINIALWNYPEYNEFVSAMQEGREQDAFALVNKIITSWDYPVPLEGSPISQLSLEDAYGVLRTVSKSFETFFDARKEEIKVNTKSWNMARKFEFDEARRERRYNLVEKMLHEVVTMEGASPDQPLNAVQGALMMKALSDHYGKLISGKF